MEFVEIKGKNLDDALTNACLELGLPLNEIEYEIVDEGKHGFWGVGAKQTVIRIKKANKLQCDKEYEKKNALKLYNKCQEKGLVVFDNETALQNLEIVARNYGALERTGAVELYELGKAESERIELEKFQKERALERERILKEKELAEIHGKIKYINDLEEKCRFNKSLLQMGDLAMNSAKINMNYKAQKTDWAIMSGAASAVGGIVPGVATAIDIQNRNIRAEEEAESIRERGKQQAITTQLTMNQANVEIRQIEEIIEYINDKLIDEENVQDKFRKIIFSNLAIEFNNKTGNLCVCGDVSLLENIELVGSPASIDGSIQIDVVDKDGSCIGSGYYSAPGFANTNLAKVGFGQVSKFSVAVWVDNYEAIYDKELYINIKPIHMWYIEQ